MKCIAGIVNTEAGEENVGKAKENLSSMLFSADGEKEFPSQLFSFSHGVLGKTFPENGFELPSETGADASFVLLDGVFLNRKELVSFLREKDPDAKKAGDAEILLLLYRELGVKAWEKLEGCFAFALYDGAKKVLYLVRDRLGGKNIYYFNTPFQTVFATTPAMLRKHDAFPEKVDEQALWDFLTLQYVPSNTIFRDVRKVPPGSYAEITFADRTFCVVKRWWKPDLSQKDDTLSFADACEELRKLVFSSTEENFASAGEGGKAIFLSGGVDSSVVGGVASLVAGGDLKVFTVGFQEAAYDEREQAAVNFANMKNFAKSNLTHLIRLVPQESTFPLLERLASSYGEPYADASLLPTSFLCAFAREEGCSFALCGDCADEFFGGYERYLAMRYLAAADQFLPSFCRKALVASGRVLLSGTGGERKLAARGRRFLEGMAKSGKERYFSMITHMTEADKLSVAGPLFRDAGVSPTLENFDPSGLLDRGTAIDPRERPNEFDLTHYLPDDCLMKAERAARSASLDLRAPFLHDRILDFALRLPYSFKEKGGYRKRILGETFADLLPKGLVHRKKRGFGVPLAAFFRGGWKEDTARTLLEGTLMKKGYFDPSGVKKLLDEHVQRGKDHSYLIFSLLMAELSLR